MKNNRSIDFFNIYKPLADLFYLSSLGMSDHSDWRHKTSLWNRCFTRPFHFSAWGRF